MACWSFSFHYLLEVYKMIFKKGHQSSTFDSKTYDKKVTNWELFNDGMDDMSLLLVFFLLNGLFCPFGLIFLSAYNFKLLS